MTSLTLFKLREFEKYREMYHFISESVYFKPVVRLIYIDLYYSMRENSVRLELI